MGLSRDQIVSEAVRLLQDEGLDMVSLRRLATRLDARAPSLARHVGDKQNLLALMSGRIFGEVLAELPDCRDWREWAMAFGEALWRKHSTTRDVARLILTVARRDDTPAGSVEPLIARLERLDLPMERAMVLQSAVQALITGWTSFTSGVHRDRIAALVPVEESVRISLTALVRGFETDPWHAP